MGNNKDPKVNFLGHFQIATQMLSQNWGAGADPAYVVGTALPDLLPLAERRVRFRPERLSAGTEFEAALRGGVSAHLATDAAFHKTAAFAAAQATVGGLLADAAFEGMRVRRFFVAHVLTEMALDAALLRADPALAGRFYGAFALADLGAAARWAEAVTGRPLPGLVPVLTRFASSQYLREYARDDGVATGLSRLCRRAGQDTFEGENFSRLVAVVQKTAARLPVFIPALLAETAAGIYAAGIHIAGGEYGPHTGNVSEARMQWRTR